MSNCKIVDVARGRKKGEGDFTKIYSPTAEAFVTPFKVLNEKKRGGGVGGGKCVVLELIHLTGEKHFEPHP